MSHFSSPEQRPGCCVPDEHRLHRRLFLKGLIAAGATAVTSFHGLFTNPVFAQATRRAQKKVILLFLCGGPSQFETWDPKPGRPSSGPFPSLPTAIPGVHFSSLMPRCARTKQNEHLQAMHLLTRGNPDRAGFTRPTLGSVISATLEKVDTKIPNYVLLDPNPEGNEFKEYKASDLAGWLGAEFQPVRLGGAYT